MKKILLVDDEYAVLKFHEKVLTNEGFAVMTAMDGEETKAIFPDFQPDLLLMDIRLDGRVEENGINLVKELGAFRKCAVVYWTSTKDESFKESGIKTGRHGWIDKSEDGVDVNPNAFIRQLQLAYDNYLAQNPQDSVIRSFKTKNNAGKLVLTPINLCQIVYINHKGIRKQQELFLDNGEKILVREGLSFDGFLTKTNYPYFLKTHRSHAINRSKKFVIRKNPLRFEYNGKYVFIGGKGYRNEIELYFPLK